MRASLLALLMLLAAGSGAAPSAPAPAIAAMAASSDLQREYPLGERPLCCADGSRSSAAGDSAGRGAAPTGSGGTPSLPSSAATVSNGRGRSSPPPAEGSAAPWLLIALVGFGAVLIGLLASRRFAFRGGYWIRLRARRRWQVGERGYRLAQLLGFRFSRERDALVLRLGGGHFGPVLQLRGAEPAPQLRPLHESDPGQEEISEPARVRAPATWPSLTRPGTLALPERSRQSADSPHRPAAARCTLDLAFLPLPGSGLWQMTAVDLGTRFVWADLVRRRNGPTAQEVATFVERIAQELHAGDRRLATLVVHAPPEGLLERDLLPEGVRLLSPERSSSQPSVAAAVHRELAETDIAMLSPRASLSQHRRALRHRLDAYNAVHSTQPPVHAGARARSGPARPPSRRTP